MRARLALHVSGTTCEIREVKLSRKPDELMAASPKGTVPVLMRVDGSAIEQSLEVMRWSLERRDPEGWLEREDRALIEANDGPFKHHLDRYKYPERFSSNPGKHRTEGLAFLRTLEAKLAVTANLCGEARGLTDMAIVPFVRQFAQTDRAWFDAQPIPHVQAWLSAHLTSALFEAIMVRLEPWQAGDAPILFPTG